MMALMEQFHSGGVLLLSSMGKALFDLLVQNHDLIGGTAIFIGLILLWAGLQTWPRKLASGAGYYNQQTHQQEILRCKRLFYRGTPLFLLGLVFCLSDMAVPGYVSLKLDNRTDPEIVEKRIFKLWPLAGLNEKFYNPDLQPLEMVANRRDSLVTVSGDVIVTIEQIYVTMDLADTADDLLLLYELTNSLTVTYELRQKLESAFGQFINDQMPNSALEIANLTASDLINSQSELRLVSDE